MHYFINKKIYSKLSKFTKDSGLILIFFISVFSYIDVKASRLIEDFNFNWKFHLGETENAKDPLFDDTDWREVNIPHDWSVELPHDTVNGGASTGFKPGGIGWYRKSFTIPNTDKDRSIWVEFDGIYNNSKVWLNGKLLAERPYGYSSFSVDLTNHLNFDGQRNVLAVRVDRSNYLDSRWYTGSGIYRNVRLIKTHAVHIPQWGVRVTTPEISIKQSKVNLHVFISNKNEKPKNIQVRVKILNPQKQLVGKAEKTLKIESFLEHDLSIAIENPTLWNLENPALYEAIVELSDDSDVLDCYQTLFGIRKFHFDADKGFFLNGKNIKIKGVNLHHDAGCVGAAVPKDVWRYRLKKLKSIGCNAIRLAHNPHSPELLDLCDEMGFLVMGEAFDEWNKSKDKHKTYLGADDAPKEVSHSYSEHFDVWAERDLKDMIRRDFNHSSVILWSIGNEIELTFPYYAATYDIVNVKQEYGKQEYYKYTPIYDSLKIKNELDKLTNGVDTLTIIAQKLTQWVKEIDTSRPVTCANVNPSIGFASGYCNTVDVIGFNYRTIEYDKAHAIHPNAKIYGSENWGSWPEWQAVKDRDFVAGIFVWTGFAYLGEAGPWPRKGLIISFFDFAGFKTPRGHFFECLWKDDPKVYVGTCPLDESEFSYNNTDGWTFTERAYDPSGMSWLRHWEWYDIFDRWMYEEGEPIVVQGYTNCEEVELFINDKSHGIKKLDDFDNRVIKWLVPYQKGELKIVGYNNGKEADSYTLNSFGKLSGIALTADRTTIHANHYDVVHIVATLLDDKGVTVLDDEEVTFIIDGEVTLLGVDNGSEYSVQPYQSNQCVTNNGKALLVIQAKDKSDDVKVTARVKDIASKTITIKVSDDLQGNVQ